MPTLVQLGKTVRSLDPNVLKTLGSINPSVLLDTLGGTSPQDHALPALEKVKGGKATEKKAKSGETTKK